MVAFHYASNILLPAPNPIAVFRMAGAIVMGWWERIIAIIEDSLKHFWGRGPFLLRSSPQLFANWKKLLGRVAGRLNSGCKLDQIR